VVSGLLLLVASRSTTEAPKARFEPTKDLFAPTPPAAARKDAQSAVTQIIGRARIVDGDTISINGVQIRLEGIDAPETAQTCVGAKGDTWQCGITGTQRLAGLVKGERVICDKSGHDRYNRTLAYCRLENGTELNAWMVRQGFALAFVRYSSKYVNEEKEAREANRGLWAGTFQAPWDWRAANQTKLPPNNGAPLAQGLVSQQKAAQARTECLVKGNINRNGDKIYHMPGSKWYAQTQIDERSGERWFCSREEAEKAGWRRAR
jgi:endonuclease YncB( thermonuclease family)